METVWKVQIPAEGMFELEMPFGAQILCVHYQDDQLDPTKEAISYLWVRVDPEKPKVTREFQLVGTGTEIIHPDEAEYVGTAHVKPFVFHLFEMKDKKDPFELDDFDRAHRVTVKR
jgi:hypothetical protein